MKLDELNKDIKHNNQRDNRYDESKYSSVTGVIASANRETQRIASLFYTERIDELPVVSETLKKHMLKGLKEGKHTFFAGKNTPGIQVLTEEDINRRIAALTKMAAAGTYYGFEGIFMASPWIKEAIEFSSPGIFAEYNRLSKEHNRLSLNIANNNISVTKGTHVDNNGSKNKSTLKSEGHTGDIIEGIIWQ
jgi:hypothetical protein